MNIFNNIGNFLSDVILIVMLLSLFNLVRYMFKIRKIMKMHKDNPNIKGISIVNGEIKVIEKLPTVFEEVTPEQPKDLVKDPVCGEEFLKEDAYRIVKDDVEYFFCSWECREKFLEQ